MNNFISIIITYNFYRGDVFLGERTTFVPIENAVSQIELLICRAEMNGFTYQKDIICDILGIVAYYLEKKIQI